MKEMLSWEDVNSENYFLFINDESLLTAASTYQLILLLKAASQANDTINVYEIFNTAKKANKINALFYSRFLYSLWHVSDTFEKLQALFQDYKNTQGYDFLVFKTFIFVIGHYLTLENLSSLRDEILTDVANDTPEKINYLCIKAIKTLLFVTLTEDQKNNTDTLSHIFNEITRIIEFSWCKFCVDSAIFSVAISTLIALTKTHQFDMDFLYERINGLLDRASLYQSSHLAHYNIAADFFGSEKRMLQVRELYDRAKKEIISNYGFEIIDEIYQIDLHTLSYALSLAHIISTVNEVIAHVRESNQVTVKINFVTGTGRTHFKQKNELQTYKAAVDFLKKHNLNFVDSKDALIKVNIINIDDFAVFELFDFSGEKITEIKADLINEIKHQAVKIEAASQDEMASEEEKLENDIYHNELKEYEAFAKSMNLYVNVFTTCEKLDKRIKDDEKVKDYIFKQIKEKGIDYLFEFFRYPDTDSNAASIISNVFNESAQIFKVLLSLIQMCSSDKSFIDYLEEKIPKQFKSSGSLSSKSIFRGVGLQENTKVIEKRYRRRDCSFTSDFILKINTVGADIICFHDEAQDVTVGVDISANKDLINYLGFLCGDKVNFDIRSIDSIIMDTLKSLSGLDTNIILFNKSFDDLNKDQLMLYYLYVNFSFHPLFENTTRQAFMNMNFNHIPFEELYDWVNVLVGFAERGITQKQFIDFHQSLENKKEEKAIFYDYIKTIALKIFLIKPRVDLAEIKNNIFNAYLNLKDFVCKFVTNEKKAQLKLSYAALFLHFAMIEDEAEFQEGLQKCEILKEIKPLFFINFMLLERIFLNQQLIKDFFTPNEKAKFENAGKIIQCICFQFQKWFIPLEYFHEMVDLNDLFIQFFRPLLEFMERQGSTLEVKFQRLQRVYEHFKPQFLEMDFSKLDKAEPPIENIPTRILGRKY